MSNFNPFSSLNLSVIKVLSNLTFSIVMACSISACGNNSDSTKSHESNNTNSSEPESVTLRFSHFWPATSPIHAEVFAPWAKQILEESNGRIKVEIYPSAQISKPNVTYDAAVKGTVDIGSQAHGYTAGRFPLSQIAELPGLSSSASQMSCIMQTLYNNGTIADEYEDSHLLFVFGAGPGVLHTTNKLIKKPEDMKGLRIRRPSAVAGDIIESMGASPVGLPAPDIYASIQRGVVDGLSFPWDPFNAFKISEVAKNHTNIPFYSSGLLVTMNKDKYESLPDDLKKVIDNNSGMKLAMKLGKVQDKYDKIALQKAIDEGDNIVNIPNPLSDPEWSKALNAGTQKYLTSIKDSGLDADAVYIKAQEASKACTDK